MEKMELRSYTSNVSFNSESDELIIEGLVNKTESWSNVLGVRKKFIEKINKGVFARALTRGKRFDFLSEHDRNLLLATTENASLELWEDEEGLKMRANIVPTSYGKDIYTLIKNRVVNHMSFGFRVLKDSWNKGVNDIYERSIEDLELIEVSAVRNPAYSSSAISARNIELIEEVDIPELEEESKEEERMNPKDLEAIADMVVAKLADKADKETTEETPVKEVIIEEKPIEETPVKEEEVKEVKEEKEVVTEEVKEEVSEEAETVEEKPSEEVKEEFDVSEYIKMIKENQKNRL